MKKKIVGIVMSLVMLFSLAPAMYAFSDVKDSRGAEHIHKLKDRGIVSGDKSDKFSPKRKLTNAEAVNLLVKAFDLNLDHVKFMKAPKASDYYPKMKNNKWYSDLFVIGYHHEIIFDKDVNPNNTISREQFASLLMAQVDRKGDYPLIMMYLEYKDANKVNEAYSNDIQKLLLTKIGALSKDDYFYPTQSITREDAAIWLDKALTFVDNLIPTPELPILDTSKLKLTEKAVNENIKAVTITTEVPHPGYSITVKGINFEGDTAYLDVEYVHPNPDMMYPQVISTATVTTYVASQYKVKINK